MNRKRIFKDLDLSHLVPINWRSNSTYLIQTYNNYISDRILDSVHMCVSNTSGSQVDVCGDILLVAHYCTSILTIEGRGRGYMFLRRYEWEPYEEWREMKASFAKLPLFNKPCHWVGQPQLSSSGLMHCSNKVHIRTRLVVYSKIVHNIIWLGQICQFLWTEM